MRVASIVNGEETRHLIDSTRMYPQVLEEYTPDGQTIASYTYGASLLSQHQNGASSFYLSDGHSGIRQLSNSDGLVTDTYDYDAYGRLLNSMGDTENNYRYRGEQVDPNLGLQYLRARYYDPNSGRFPSVDPFEGMLDEPMSRHRYLYGNNNPVVYADPSGEVATFTQLAPSSTLTIVQNAITTVGQKALGSKLLPIAFGLLGTAGAITTAAAAYSFWRSRNRGILWDGTFSLTTIPSYGAPQGTPSSAIGVANLISKESPRERAKVAAVGASYTLSEILPTKLPKFSEYSVQLGTPDVATAMQTPRAANRGAFLGPFVFSTLRFTFPYIVPDDLFAISSADQTDGVLALGFGVGFVQKGKNVGKGGVYDGLLYDPFELGFKIGFSSPIA